MRAFQILMSLFFCFQTLCAKDCSLVPAFKRLSARPIEERTVPEHQSILSISPKIWACSESPDILYHKTLSALALYQLPIAENAVHHYFNYIPKKRDSLYVLMLRLKGHLAWEHDERDEMFRAYTAAVSGMESGIEISSYQKSKIYLDLGMAHKLHETHQDSLMLFLGTKSIENARQIPNASQRERLLARSLLYRGNLIYQWKSASKRLQFKGLQDLWKAESILRKTPDSPEYIDALGSLGLLHASYYDLPKRGFLYTQGAVKVAKGLDEMQVSPEQKKYSTMSAQLFHSDLLFQLHSKSPSPQFDKTKSLLNDVLNNELALPADQELAWSQLAFIAAHEGNTQQAIEFAKRALDLGKLVYENLGSEWIYDSVKKHRRLYNLLVRSYLKLNQPNLAFEMLAKSNRLYPQIFKSQYQSLAKLSTPDRQLAESTFYRQTQILQKQRLSFEDYLAISELEIHKQRTLFRPNVLQEADTLAISDIQLRLKDAGENLLVYFMDAEFPTQNTLFIILPNALHHVPLSCPAPKIDTNQLSNPQLLAQLYTCFFAPAKPLLNAKRLAIIGGLPIPHAAFLNQERFLVEEYSTRYGNAVEQLFTPSNKPSSWNGSFWGRSTFSHPLPNLPAVKEEADFAKTIWSDVYLDVEMKRKPFLSNLQKAQMIHLSTHGVLHTNPIFSGFYFSPESPSELLHFFEFYGKPIRSSLIFLSSCHSGALHGQNSYQNFPSIFLAAGAQSIVSSRWEASDNSALSLMRHFYGGLQKGLSTDIALQKAQIHWIKSASPIQRSPYFWSGFTLDGITLSFNP